MNQQDDSERQNQVDGILDYLIQSGIISDVFNGLFTNGGSAGIGGGGFNEPRAPPPASKKAIEQLPTIMVQQEDLADENNRACCICLEPNNIKDRVKRLPCAHIFHEQCILSWLRNTNTCPVCRYELETEDESYEPVRLERMSNRKPRIHPYELERMSFSELQAFTKLYGITISTSSEQAAREAILRSDKVEIITTANAPITDMKYTMEQLRSMKVAELRQTMANAGVFFDPKNVIEKEDMVRIFCNSGRFTLVEKEKEKKEPEKKKNGVTNIPVASNKKKKNEKKRSRNESNRSTTAINTTRRGVRSNNDNSSQGRIARATIRSSQQESNATIHRSSMRHEHSNNNNNRRESTSRSNNNINNRTRMSKSHSVVTRVGDSRQQNQDDEDDDELWC